MEIFWSVVLLLVGMLLIIKGGDWFLDGAVGIAKKTGISELVIGATIVSIGTTLPELIASITGVINGLKYPDKLSEFIDLAVNNATGSMLCNMGLILAIVMMCTNIKTEGTSYSYKALYLMFTTIILAVFVTTGSTIVIWEAIVLLIGFVLFMLLNLYDAKSTKKPLPNLNAKDMVIVDDTPVKKTSILVGLFLLGSVAIAGGAQLLVKEGEFLATAMGIPSQIIGITVLAVGTSLPELVTAIKSLKSGNAHLSMGNIIGANIINATLLLGLSAVISGQGLAIDTFTSNYSIWFMLGITAVTLLPSIFTKKTHKIQGVIMLLGYLAMLTVNIVTIV